jgi:uncharacterized membrane protein
MLRSHLLAGHAETVDGFRWRCREITRIEGFSDAVFGFAVTLLITDCVLAATQVVEQTRSQQRTALVLYVIVLAIFLGLMALMAKGSRERKKKLREWLSRMPETPAPPPDLPSPS